MATNRFTVSFSTKGNAHVVDITDRVQDGLESQPIEDGVATVFCPGATGALTTIEFEPGLVQDVAEIFEKLIPEGKYNHDSHIHSGNAHSHLRATITGPSVSVPFEGKKLSLGTWQQIAFIDFDNRSRDRELIVQVVG